MAIDVSSAPPGTDSSVEFWAGRNPLRDFKTRAGREVGGVEAEVYGKVVARPFVRDVTTRKIGVRWEGDFWVHDAFVGERV